MVYSEFWISVYLRSCICLCLTVFVCLTPGSSATVVLVPRPFQKYSTCMVYSEFLFSGKNQPLEGEGGPKTYCTYCPTGQMTLRKTSCNNCNGCCSKYNLVVHHVTPLSFDVIPCWILYSFWLWNHLWSISSFKPKLFEIELKILWNNWHE